MAQRPSLLDDAKLAADLNLTRLALWRLRRRGDLIARLESATKSEDPYPLYEVVRRQGVLTPGKFGIAITASHALASQLLRSPAMGHGARQQDGPPPGAAREDTVHPIHDAFIVMNPPDHTRLRRLVSGAFTPRGSSGCGRASSGSATGCSTGSTGGAPSSWSTATPLPCRSR
jgi:cytochrome P450